MDQSVKGVLGHVIVDFSSMRDSPLPLHNQARNQLREFAVLHEFAKREKEEQDHLTKIHHRALVADRLERPLVFVSTVVESHVAACSCCKNFLLQFFKRQTLQDCLVQRIERKSACVIFAWGKRYSHELFVRWPKNPRVAKAAAALFERNFER